MGLDKFNYDDFAFPGIYRGTVVFNVDPDVKGKLKIFVHGVYPDEYFDKHQLLPWAEPAMSLFGGNWTNEKPDAYGNHLNDQVGWCTVPHQGLKAATGSQVYVFFQNSDINKPVYFAAAQSGKGWFSEHPNQHVFRTDNIQIRIDEETTHPDSTCKFDTYNQHNNDMSIHDGTKEKVETRLDIQIMAKDINAVNLQISGNVNLHLQGDMYTEHYGDRHDTHIGNVYTKHVGNTYIEQQGNYNLKHTGKTYSEYIEAQKSMTVFGNVHEIFKQDEYKSIDGHYNTKVGKNYERLILGDCTYTVQGNDTRDDYQDCKVTIAGNTDVIIGKNTAILIGNEDENKAGNATVNVAHDILLQSVNGNIDVNTLGKFELLNGDGTITANGYNNIGTKGNIKITSTLGNIALQTVNDVESNPNLTDASVVIPWNPVFLSNVSLISLIFSDFDPKKALNLNFSSILNISSITQFLDFLTALPTTVIYDGLPSFFPCKMINQNPNSKGVDQVTWAAGEYRNYSKEEQNWQQITNQAYWKVLGKLIGNIDINSWSGDINIKTHGQLGNAGNINISANDQVGSLSTNKNGTGNVNISNQSKYRIYTDPRNLFFDSQSIFNRLTILSNGGAIPDPANPGNMIDVDDIGGVILGCVTLLHKKNTAGRMRMLYSRCCNRFNKKFRFFKC